MTPPSPTALGLALLTASLTACSRPPAPGVLEPDDAAAVQAAHQGDLRLTPSWSDSPSRHLADEDDPAAPIAAAPTARPGEYPAIRGRVVDVRSGGGMCDLEVTLLHGPGRVQRTTTDASGRIEVLHPRGSTNPVEVPFHVGPEFDVVLAGDVPDSVDDLWFGVIAEGDERCDSRSPLRQREDGTLWVRMHPIGRAGGPGRTDYYVIADAAGTRFAGRRAPMRGEATGAPLEFELETTGVISAEVVLKDLRDPAEEWSFTPALVTIESSEATPPLLWAWRSAARAYLPPASYTLTASTREHVPAACSVSVAAGEATRVRIELDRPARSRRILGTLRTTDAGPLEAGPVTVALEGEPTRAWYVTDEREHWCGAGVDHAFSFSEDGRTATFTLERVPVAPLSVSVSPWTRPVRFSTTENEEGDIELEIVEYEPERGFGFRFLDGAQHLGELGPFLTTRVHDGGPPLPRRLVDGALVGDGDPAARRFDWAISHGGPYRTVFGDASSFREASDGVWLADVRFVPGWAACIEAVDRTGRPAARVHVLADGAVVGETNVAGRLFLELDDRPGAVSLAIPGRARSEATPPGSSPWVRIVAPE